MCRSSFLDSYSIKGVNKKTTTILKSRDLLEWVTLGFHYSIIPCCIIFFLVSDYKA